MSTVQTVKASRCPRCNSKSPSWHPATQWEGEVQLCPDLWHDDPVTAKARAEEQQR